MQRRSSSSSSSDEFSLCLGGAAASAAPPKPMAMDQASSSTFDPRKSISAAGNILEDITPTTVSGCDVLSWQDYMRKSRSHGRSRTYEDLIEEDDVDPADEKHMQLLLPPLGRAVVSERQSSFERPDNHATALLTEFSFKTGVQLCVL